MIQNTYYNKNVANNKPCIMKKTRAGSWADLSHYTQQYPSGQGQTDLVEPTGGAYTRM